MPVPAGPPLLGSPVALITIGAARAQWAGRTVDLPFGTPAPEIVSHRSTGWVGVPVQAFDDTGIPIDVTELTIRLAFPTDGTDPVTWLATTWHQGVDDQLGRTVQWADVLVGPTSGAVNLSAVGDYRVWWQDAASPIDVIGRAPGRLVIT